MLLQVCRENKADHILAHLHLGRGLQLLHDVCVARGDREARRGVHVLKNRAVVPDHRERVPRLHAEEVVATDVTNVVRQRCHQQRADLQFACLGNPADLRGNPHGNVAHLSTVGLVVVAVRQVARMNGSDPRAAALLIDEEHLAVL